MMSKKGIEERLQQLPVKIALPFRRLLDSEQITEETLEVILDAGDLSQQAHLMLGFAIAYLHLRSQGVPIDDVVRMAKARRRRLNLTWSTKRWKDEHERLSRVETLERLAEKNVRYDLSKFEEHLPAHFGGYLIPSSRRLGMEGLRQRHCVASYHHKIMTGDCAIAALFVDGQRWTVEMVITGRKADPILIVQIKSRYNQSPSRLVKEAIHDQLGVLQKAPVGLAEKAETHDRQYLHVLRCVLPVLQESGVGKVYVTFDGSGDSGAVEDISFEAGDREDVFSLLVEHPKVQRTFEEGRWISQVLPVRQTVREALEELTYDYLEETGVDWYNDDGGYGELIISVEEGSVFLDVNVRFTEASNEVQQEHDIATGLEIG